MNRALLTLVILFGVVLSASEPPQPPSLYGEELPTEIATIVYIIDCSCSMDSGWQTWMNEDGNQLSGYRMDRAKSEICPSIGRLREDLRFDIVSTDVDGYAYFGQLVPATNEHKASACAFVEELTGGGETGLGPAVAWALEADRYHEALNYVIATGGVPTCCIDDSRRYWQDVLDRVREANHRSARIHLLVITPDPEDHVLEFAEAITAETSGTLTVLHLEEFEDEEP